MPAITTTTNGMQPPAIPAVALGNPPPKKTRAPPKLKATAIPASAPVSPVAAFKRQPPPSQHRQVAPQPAGPQSPTPNSAAPLPDAMSPNSEMDALTKGLKKVTLKLGTREEHDRKMKEKLDSERRARALKGAETRRINKAARDAELSKSRLTPAQRAKLGPDGAGVAETSKSKLASAQKAKLVPDTTRAEVNAVPAVGASSSNVLPAAATVQPVPVALNEMSGSPLAVRPMSPQLTQQYLNNHDGPAELQHWSTVEKLHNEPPHEQQHTAPIDPSAQQTAYGLQSSSPSAAIGSAIPEPPTETTPPFTIPTYSAPPLPAVSAPTTTPAPAPAPLPSHSPTMNTNTFFNPSYAPQQPQQPLTHSRQSSSPVIDETTTYQASPVGGLHKHSPHERDASARDGVDRQLPIFSATSRIPFASNGPADAGAGAVQGGSRLKEEMEMDGNGYSGVWRGGSGWEVPETAEK